MNKRSMSCVGLVLLSIMFINFVSACGETIEPGNPTRLIFQSNASSLNITIEYVNASGFWVDSQPMTKSGYTFYYDFYNTSEMGLLRFFACDPSGDCDYRCSKRIGRNLDTANILGNISLILIFLGIGFIIYLGNRRIDHEKYWNSITNKWMDKNYLKFSSLVVWYNIRKNSFILYYLIGLVIMIIVYEISLFYTTNYSLFKTLLTIYTWGSLIVVIVFFGQAQEWLKEWQEQLMKINWGGIADGKR